MALSARDLYFAVRVEDRATRPLRRIAADFRALQKAGLDVRRRDLDTARLAAQRATSSKRAAEAELKSVQAGTRKLAVEKSMASANVRTMNAKLKQLGLDRDALRLASQRTRLENQISNYDRRLKGPQSKGGPSLSQLRGFRLAATQSLSAVSKSEQILAGKAGLSVQAMRQTELELRRVIAAEAARIAREAELKNIILSRAEAERLAFERVKDAQIAVDRFPIDRLQTIGRYVSHLGRVFTLLGGTAAIALGFAAKASADFNTQVTLAATQSTAVGNNTVKAVSRNAAFIQKEIQKMMAGGKVIAQPEEQTSAIYRIFSGTTLAKGNAGLKQGISLLKEFNDLTTANVGLVSLEESTKAGIILLNRFKIPVKDLPKELNTMQAAVRFGDMTLSEFIGTLGTAAPAAQAAGYNFTSMAGAIAFLSRQFPSLRMGATGYARLIETFARKDVVEGLKARGVEITQNVNGTKKLLPITEIARKVIDKFGGSVKNGSVFVQNFFKEIGKTQSTNQARRVLQSYVQNYGQASLILKQVTRDKNELDKSLKSAQSAPGVRWKEFTVQLKAIALEIGTGVIPAIAELAGFIRPAASWFNNLGESTKKAVGYFAFLISVGSVLSGIFLILSGGVIQFVAVLKLISAAGGIRNFLGLASAAGQARIDMILLLGVVGLLVGAFVLFPSQTKSVINALGGMTDALVLLGSVMVGLRIARFVLALEALQPAALMAATGMTALEASMLPLIGTLGLVLAAAGAVYLIYRRIKNATKDHRTEAQKENDFYIQMFKTLQAQGRSVRDAKQLAGEATRNKFGNLFVPQTSQWKKEKAAFQEYFNAVIAGRRIGGKSLGPKDFDRARAQATSFVQDKFKDPTFNPQAAEKASQKLLPKLYQDTIKSAKLALVTQKQFNRTAAAAGVDATPSFKKLYTNYINAARALKMLKDSGKATAGQLFEAETAKQNAALALQQNIGDQKSAAAVKAGNDLVTQAQKFSDKEILVEARKVKSLERIANNSKTYAAWKTYYAALSKLQKDASDSQMQAIQQMFDSGTIQKFSDAAIAAEAKNVQRLERMAKHQKTFASWKAYYKALNKLQTDATDSQLQAAQQIFDTTAKKADAATNKIKQKYQQVLQNLKSQYQSFDSQNQNLFGQLFQGPYTQSAVVQDRLQFGAGPIANLNKNDLVKDLRSQVTRFASIQKNVGKLRGKGLPSAMLKEIESLGPEEAQKMLQLINSMTPAQIKEYSRLWKRGQKEVHDATMRDVKSQLKEWRRHGRRIALAIAAGLRDENTVLETSLRSLITGMFPELAGKNKNTPAHSTPGHVQSTGAKTATKTENHTHYHVTAPHSEHASIKKQLDKANWHHRTRQK